MIEVDKTTSMPTQPAGSDPAALPTELPPMTFATLGRFFGVPLLIIGIIVGGAVFVVFLFGGPAAPRERSMEQLLQALESNMGERSAGVLLPREKELWQAALELSERLRKKDVELKPDEIQSTAERLATMVRADFAHLDTITAFKEDERAAQRQARGRRFEFLLKALARTGTATAVPTMIEIIESGREPYVTIAIQQLGELHELAEAKSAKGVVVEALRNSPRNETKIVACVVLSLLASPGEPGVINALSDARLANEGEVAWNAALALARLGSTAGKTTLMDMLDRSYWERGERYETVDASGVTHRYPMPPARIDSLIMAAVDAAVGLDDADLRAAVDRLQSDRSLVVRGHVKKALEKRNKG